MADDKMFGATAAEWCGAYLAAARAIEAARAVEKFYIDRRYAIGSPEWELWNAFDEAARAATQDARIDVAQLRRAEGEAVRFRAALERIIDDTEGTEWTHGMDGDEYNEWITCDGRSRVRTIAEEALEENDPALEWAIAAQYIPAVCPTCGGLIETVEAFKQARIGITRDVVHIGCWEAYESRLREALALWRAVEYLPSIGTYLRVLEAGDGYEARIGVSYAEAQTITEALVALAKSATPKGGADAATNDH